MDVGPINPSSLEHFSRTYFPKGGCIVDVVVAAVCVVLFCFFVCLLLNMLGNRNSNLKTKF